MTTLATIQFHDVVPDSRLADLIQNKVRKLERFGVPIHGCQVWVRAHQSRKTGNAHEVKVVLRVPGGDVVVRSHGDVTSKRELAALVRSTMDRVAQQLRMRKSSHKGASLSSLVRSPIPA